MVRSQRRSIQATAAALVCFWLSFVTAESTASHHEGHYETERGKSLRGGGKNNHFVQVEKKTINLLDDPLYEANMNREDESQVIKSSPLRSTTTENIVTDVVTMDTLSSLARLGLLRDPSAAITTTTTSTTTTSSTRRLQNTTTPCVLPESGFFGGIAGTPRTVNFQYQAVVTSGTSITQVKQDVLPALDAGIVEGILPNFFACPNAIPTGEIIGISSQLVDLVVGGITCASTVPGDCYTFDGRLTVFGPTTNVAAENVVLPAIQTLMTTTNLSTLSPLLVDVDMVVGDGTGSVTTTPPVGTPAPQLPVTPGQTPSPAVQSPTTAAPALVPTPIVPGTTSPGSQTTLPPVQTPSPLPPGQTPAPGGVVPIPSPAPGTVPAGTSAPIPSPSAGTNSTQAPAGSGSDPTTVTNEAQTGIEKLAWWAWVLIALGGIVVCFIGVSILKNSNRHAPLPDVGATSKKSSSPNSRTAPGTPESPYGNSGDVGTYDAPAPYVPPGPDIVASFPLSSSAAAAPMTTDYEPPVASSALSGPNKGRLRPVGENEEFPDEQDGHYDDDEDYDDDEEGEDYDDGEEEDYDDEGEGEGGEGDGEYDDEEGEGEYDDQEEGEYEDEEGGEDDGQYANDDQEYAEEEDGEYEDGDYGDEEGEDDQHGGGEVYEDGEEEGGEGDFEEYSEYDEETIGQSQEDDNKNWGKEFVSTGGSGGSY